MKKKLLLFVATLLPLLASAYDLVDEKGLFYNIKGDGTLEVVGLDAETTEADILSDVTIGGVEYRVTSIGERAFEGRSNLTYLSIPWSVTSIGEYAFIDCGSNITVNIADPESWCKMELGNEHSSPLSSAGKVLVFDIEKTSIDIPEGVTSIGKYTFYQCKCITSLTIPSSVKSIGSSAFEDCTGLTSLTLSEGLESIGGSAFEGCTGLKILKIPSTVKTISINAFANCTGITDVYCYAVNVPVTNENAFDGTPTKKSTLHVPTNSVGVYSESSPWSDFKETLAVARRVIHVATAGTLPNLISDDEKYQIDELTLTGKLNGTDLYFIRMMAGIDHKGSPTPGPRYNSTNGILKSLDLSNATIVSGGRDYMAVDDYFPSGPKHTSSEAGYNPVYTKDNTITSVFLYGTKIESIVLPNTINTINSLAFINSKITFIAIPSGVFSIAGDALSGCPYLESIKVEEGNLYYDSRDECNAIIESSSNSLINGCMNTTIPTSVTSIGSSAFSGCSRLSSITIPNGVTSIGNNAFEDCTGLTSVTIPDNITSIGDYVFNGCTGLTSITIPDNVTSIGDYAFYGCTGLTSIIIPDNVTSIGNSAFQRCKGLVYITLPHNLSSIGYAFFGCNSLTDVYCKAETVPSAENNSFSNPGNITLYVPSASLAAYKSTEPWSKFKAYYSLSNSDLEATEKCSKPTISIVDGKFVFSCETSGVSYRWSISTSNGNNGSGIPTLPITLNVFATKSGYLNSDVATYEFNGLVGDVDGNGVVNVADHVKLSSIIMEQSE